jgi:glucokinase
MINLLGPEVIVLGGGVIEAIGDPFIARIEKAARGVAFKYAMKDVRLAKAELGDDAGIVGAAMLAIERASRVPRAEAVTEQASSAD